MTTKEEAMQLAIATNVNFILLDKINKMSKAVFDLIVSNDEGESLSPDVKDFAAVVAKECVISKGVLTTVLENYSDLLGEYNDSNEIDAKQVRADLDKNKIILDIARSMEMTPQERIIEILQKAGKLD